MNNTIQIINYNESLADQIIAAFNHENAGNEFVVPLTKKIFSDQITSKSCFSAEGCFVAMAGDKALGFALTCKGVNEQKTDADAAVGAIDGLFFPADRLDIGRLLADKCLEHLRNNGAKTIYGFASWAGYPFWRGLYCGLEPVCLTSYQQAWITFMSCKFRHHQQSLNFLGETIELPYRKDLDYTLENVDTSSPWRRNSWKGHEPKVIIAYHNGVKVGSIEWAIMPYFTDYWGVKTAGISAMNVNPDFRRQGIASSIMGRLFEVAAQSGVRRILVGTTVDNMAARGTYEKAAMKVVAFRSGTMCQYE